MRAWRMDWSDTPQASAISAWVIQPATRSVAVAYSMIQCRPAACMWPPQRGQAAMTVPGNFG